MSNDYVDFVKFVLTTFAIVALVIAVAYAVVDGNYCEKLKSLNAGFEFQWDFWTGCLIKAPSGLWLRMEEYHYIEGDINAVTP